MKAEKAPAQCGAPFLFSGSLRPRHWGALTPYVSSASIWTFFSLFTASSFHFVFEVLQVDKLRADAGRHEGASDDDEVGADLRPDEADVFVEVVHLHHHGQACHVVVEQRRHAKNLTGRVVDQKAVIPRVPIDVCHDRIHHDHFAEGLFSAVFGGEGKHVVDIERTLEKAVSGDESLAFRCEQGAFAGELFVESKQRIGNVVDFCSVEQVGCELLGIRFEPRVRITGGTALQK